MHPHVVFIMRLWYKEKYKGSKEKKLCSKVHLLRRPAVRELARTVLVLDHGSDILQKGFLFGALGTDGASLVGVEVGNDLDSSSLWALRVASLAVRRVL